MASLVDANAAQRRVKLNKPHCLYELSGRDFDPRHPLWCGNPRLPGKAYCQEHYDRCFQRVPAASGRPFALPSVKRA